MIRVLHTSDWHLGHCLLEQPRLAEQQAFLNWLITVLAEERIDALVICGDIFDTANPSAQAQEMWYRFLATAQGRLPGLEIVAVGGNHDSAARLDAPAHLLTAFRVRVVGGLPWRDDGTVAWERLVVPLHDSAGKPAAVVAAVPFLRQADLPPSGDGDEAAPVSGMRQRYAEAIAAAKREQTDGMALLVTGHCYMTGGVLSELSERKILGGNQHALPVDIFPDDSAYVALGHLHRHQTVGGRDHICYSGSPLPLSLPEASYRSVVCVAAFEGDALVSVREIPVPRTVAFLRVPASGALSLAELLTHLHALPDAGAEAVDLPYLEVSPLLAAPEPALRERILAAVAGKGVRLVKITSVYTGAGGSLDREIPGQGLQDITPEEVFLRRYQARFDSDPPAAYLAAYHELLEQVATAEEGR